jgi:sec-independent protein translocase protein TatA
MPGLPELLVILVIVLIVFGANKLPGIGDALGKTIRNFKRASAEGEVEEEPAPRRKLAAARKVDALEGASADAAATDDDDDEWEEVVVRRKKKSSASSAS